MKRKGRPFSDARLMAGAIVYRAAAVLNTVISRARQLSDTR